MGSQRLNPRTDGRPDSRPDVREEAPGLGNLESDFNFNQSPRPPLLLPPEPAPGPASNPPGGAPPAATPPSVPAPPTAPLASVPPLILQLTASVAPRQDLRINHGRIYLMVGCNMACSIYTHGHLNLTRGRRHLGLQPLRTSLAAHRTWGIALSLSRPNLSAVRRALRKHRSVKASIEVQATGADGMRQDYLVSVVLTWR